MPLLSLLKMLVNVILGLIICKKEETRTYLFALQIDLTQRAKFVTGGIMLSLKPELSVPARSLLSEDQKVRRRAADPQVRGCESLGHGQYCARVEVEIHPTFSDRTRIDGNL